MGSKLKVFSFVGVFLSWAANFTTLAASPALPWKWLLAVPLILLLVALIWWLGSKWHKFLAGRLRWLLRHNFRGERVAKMLANGRLAAIQAIGGLRKGDDGMATKVMQAVAQYVPISELLAAEPVPDLDAHCTMIWMLGQKPEELERDVLRLFDSGRLGSQFERVRSETAQTLKAIAGKIVQRREEVRAALWQWIATDACQEVRKKAVEAYLEYWDRHETEWLKDGFRGAWRKRADELMEKCVELWEQDGSPESSRALLAVARHHSELRTRCLEVLLQRGEHAQLFDEVMPLVAWSKEEETLLNDEQTELAVRILKQWDAKGRLRQAADHRDLTAKAKTVVDWLDAYGY